MECSLASCISPLSLNQTVSSYNQSFVDIINQQLLLNIARASHRQPLHFTAVSSVAATFNYQVNAGFGAAASASTALVAPTAGIGYSENPTISIVPISGEEFTRRLLTPLSAAKLTLLLRQGVDVDLILRLSAADFRVIEGGEEKVFVNDPSDREGYEIFRRVVLHLSSIQDQHQLYIEPLMFTRTWQLPGRAVDATGFQALEEEHDLAYDAQSKLFKVSRMVNGRMLITNYDPFVIAEAERQALNDIADRAPPNQILVDVRADHPGGSYPFRGSFRLRSFNTVMEAIGRSIHEAPEFDVVRDKRTPLVLDNPAMSLAVIETDAPLDGAQISVEEGGRYFSLKPDEGYPWNQEAFRQLFHLFQMTVTETPKFGTPSITIAK